MQVNVRFIVEVPDGIDQTHIREWVTAELKSGDLSVRNPLFTTEITPKYGTIEVEVIR